MFNVRKSIIAILASAAVATAAVSCDNTKKERAEAAQDLLTKAEALVGAHKYDSAMVLLDTLDRSYRDCLEQRKAGTTVRLRALADLSRDSLASAELQLRELKARLDELNPKFKKIEMTGTDGFFVYAPSYTGSEMNRTCIQPRVDDGGYFFIVANVAGKKIGLNSLEYNGVATARGESVVIEGSEIMSLSQESTRDFVDALCKASAPANVTLQGTHGKTAVKIDAKGLEAIRATREYADALQKNRSLNITAEKLERQLAKLNDNIANKIPVDSVE